jgi:predicted ribosome quality control (RQC) complex YloA/Tae2 family protein
MPKKPPQKNPKKRSQFAMLLRRTMDIGAVVVIKAIAAAGLDRLIEWL